MNTVNTTVNSTFSVAIVVNIDYIIVFTNQTSDVNLKTLDVNLKSTASDAGIKASCLYLLHRK